MTTTPPITASTATPQPPDLRLVEVRVQGFRALKDVEVPIEAGTTLLVGANNSGKTSFLDALDIALNWREPDERDFHVGADGKRAAVFTVDVRFEPRTGNDFEEGLRGQFGKAIQIPPKGVAGPEFVAVRYRASLIPGGIESERRFMRGWLGPGTPSPEPLPQHVGREQLGRVAYSLLAARRDVVTEMGNRRSLWGRLTTQLGFDPTAAEGLQAQLAAIGDEIVTGSPRLTQIRSRLDQVGPALGGARVGIAPIPVRLEDLARGMDVTLQSSASASFSIAQQGMGARSLASLLVFRASVEAALEEKLAPLPITAIEEPEAHLHPQSHRAALRVIDDLPGQRLVTTHSPFVTQPADIHTIRVFSRRGAATECRAIPRLRGGKPAFTEDELTAMKRTLLRRNAEALFARVVVLLEGETEATAIPILAGTRWKDPDGEGISFIDVGGAPNLRPAARLLCAAGIPWVGLMDGDKAGADAGAAMTAEAGKAAVSPIRIVTVPDARTFEGHLAHACPELLQTAFTNEALDHFRQTHQGNPRPKNKGKYDYTQTDGLTTLLVDFMEADKVECARQFAIAALDKGFVPPAVEMLFAQVDEALRPTSP